MVQCWGRNQVRMRGEASRRRGGRAKINERGRGREGLSGES